MPVELKKVKRGRINLSQLYDENEEVLQAFKGNIFSMEKVSIDDHDDNSHERILTAESLAHTIRSTTI